MTSTVRWLFIFVLGAVSGALLAGVFWAHSLDTWHSVLQVNYAVEQELRSSRAEREGNLIEALHHQRNVVHAQSPEWLAFSHHWETPPPWFPVHVFVLDRISAAAPPLGAERVNGAQRAQLARLLEMNGYSAEAEVQWNASAAILGFEVGEIQRLAREVSAVRQSDGGRDAERAVLEE